MSEYLLDTDTCVELLRGNPIVVSHTQAQRPSALAISVLTRYELLYGVERCESKRRARERVKVLRLLDQVSEAPFTAETAALAAVIRSDLASRGQPIGAIDILIAACALQEKRVLVSHNLREFSRVEGLPLESWNQPSGGVS